MDIPAPELHYRPLVPSALVSEASQAIAGRRLTQMPSTHQGNRRLYVIAGHTPGHHQCTGGIDRVLRIDTNGLEGSHLLPRPRVANDICQQLRSVQDR